MIAIGERPRYARISHKSRKLLHGCGVVQRHGHDTQRKAKIARHNNKVGMSVLYLGIAGFQCPHILGVGIKAAADVDVSQVEDTEILGR